MKIQATILPNATLAGPLSAQKEPAEAQVKDGFQASAKEDFAAFKPSKALLAWAEKAPVKTLPQMFEQAVAKDPEARYLGRKVGDKFEFITYAQADQQRKELASGLVELGIQPGERVATFAENSPNWVVGDLGIITSGAVHAPLYRDSKGEAIAYNLQNSKAKMIVVDSDERMAEVIKMEGQLPELTTIVAMHQTELKTSKRLVSWDEVMKSGRENLDKNSAELKSRQDNMKATDVASMVFTSGTTGTPKGVLHTHGSLISSVEGALRIVTDQPQADLKDVHMKGDLELSVLPLGHIFERVVAYTLTAAGGALAYPNGHKDFMADVAQTRPTVLAAVPKMFDKILEGTQEIAASRPLVSKTWGIGGGAAALAAVGAAVGGPIGAAVGGLIGAGAGYFASTKTQGQALNWALDVSEKYYRERDKGDVSLGTSLKHTVAKKLVYSGTTKKLQEKIGDKMRIMISGGAPLSDRTSAFFWDNNLQLSNGYGTSEIGVTNVNPLHKQRLGTVGPTVSNVELEIKPEADFQGHGEIKFRGPTLMLGYLNDPKKTAEAIDSEGFYHTGDIGTTDAGGHVLITGRLKNYVALATGKKVAAEPLETLLKKSPFISHVIVVGEARPYVGALIVPNYQKLGEWASQNGISGSPEQLADNPVVKKFFSDATKELTKNLDQHEQVWKVALLPRDLHEDELAKGEPKRNVILKTFADRVDSIYAK